MKLLLDTHIWLWISLEPHRLSGRVKRSINNASNELWISPISVWEIALQQAKGRIRLEGGLENWVQQTTVGGPLREAPLTNEIVLATRGIRLPHNDPADLFLAATAKILGLKLVTADQNLVECPDVEVLPNR